MATKNVPFYPTSQPLLGGKIQREYAPARNMAQSLMQAGGSMAPVQSWQEGMARALQGGIGGYLNYATMKAQGDREAAQSQGITDALKASNQMIPGMPGVPVGGYTGMVEGELGTPDIPAQRGGWQAFSDALPEGRDFNDARMRANMGLMQQQQTLEAAELARTQAIAARDEKRTYDEGVTERKNRAAIELKGSPEPESNMPFSGTGMEAQDRNILLRGDPSSAAYASAYANQSNPRISVGLDGRQTIVTPNMSWAREPTYNSNNIPTNTLNGNPLNRPTTEDATQSTLGPNAPTITTSQPKRLLPAVKAKIDKAVNGAATLVNSLLNYQKTFKAADFTERGKSALGLSTPSNNAWTSAALMAKGEELYNLGVLSGPDLEIIQKAFPDPSTRKGALASDADIDSSVNTVIKLIQDKITGMQRINNVPIINIRNFAKELKGLVPNQTQDVDEEIPQESIDAEIERRRLLLQNKGASIG